MKKKALCMSGEEGYCAYRIPALLTTPPGTVLAFYEDRLNSFGDAGVTILRRSVDGGRAWTPQQVVAARAGMTCGCGPQLLAASF